MRRRAALMSLACGLASARPRDGFDLRDRAGGARQPIVFLSGGPGFPPRRPPPRSLLIVHGENDPIGRTTLIPPSTLCYIPRCGHFLWLEQPDAFRRIVAEFLGPR